MKCLFPLFVFFVLCSNQAQSQGCIAVRNIVGFGQFALPENDVSAEPVKWLVNVNSRYFTSFKTYNGNEHVYEADEDLKTNHVFVTDLSLTRMLENGWSISLDVPITTANRTSWQEHGNDAADKTQYTTRAVGISDIRLTLYKWLMDVSTYHKGNIQLGLGLKLPTGNYHSEDYFHRSTGLVLAPVNQSIQLGDGGTGFTFELNSYYTFNKTISFYGNLFYLLSPKDQNGTSSTLGNPASQASINATANINSVPDGYTARAGASFAVKNFSFSAGARVEGSPVHDVIGESNGGRRSGYIVSIEPGVNYKFKKSILYAYVPVPFYKTTKLTVPDQRLIDAGVILPPTNTQSAGGFADYMIFLGLLIKM